jgi:hypothetical protein
MPAFSPILTSVESEIFHILAILITYHVLLQQHFTFELPVFSSSCSRLRQGRRPQAKEFLSTAEVGHPIPYSPTLCFGIGIAIPKDGDPDCRYDSLCY